jgi:hypothetical protein
MDKINNVNSPFFAGNKSKWFIPRGYYMHSYSSFDMTVHSHSRIEIMYVATGEIQIEYQLGENEFQKTTILPNNYVFVDANVPHKICINNISTLLYNIEFSLKDSTSNSFSIAGICSKENYVNSFFNQKRGCLFALITDYFCKTCCLFKNISATISTPHQIPIWIICFAECFHC